MTTHSYSPVFVVGTGRCGSTLLSSIINTHPDILSISECFSFISDFGTRIGEAFCEDAAVSSDYFWGLIGGCHKKQNLMLEHDVAMDEVLYPWKNPGYQYNDKTGVPAILQAVLPHLTEECDTLFLQVRDFVLAQEKQPIQGHYSALFQYLQTLFNKKFWVERSGGSLRIIHRLERMFPNAKFVHIVRDGRDCAISMSRHYGFRMVITAFQMIEILGLDPYEDSNRDFASDLPDELYPLLPEHFDRQAFIDYDIPLSLYGHYWSGELMASTKTLQHLSKDRLLTVQYEQLLQQPKETIARLMAFMNLADTDEKWLSDVCATIRQPRSSWRNLSLAEQKTLEEACAPGFEVLEKASA
jgi:hypothetical protein